MRLHRFAVLCSLGFLAVASTMVAQDEIPSQPIAPAQSSPETKAVPKLFPASANTVV